MLVKVSKGSRVRFESALCLVFGFVMKPVIARVCPCLSAGPHVSEPWRAETSLLLVWVGGSLQKHPQHKATSKSVSIVSPQGKNTDFHSEKSNIQENEEKLVVPKNV